MYEATARVLIRTIAADTTVLADPNAQAPFYADRQLKNQEQVLMSTEVRAAVAAAYHGDLDVYDVVATATVAGSDTIDVSVVGPDPQDAADLVTCMRAPTSR